MCIICKIKFKSKISLVFHQSKEHHIFIKPKKNVKSGFCSECGTNQLCILDHMNRVHILPKIRCTQCIFKTRYKKNLEMHFKKRHTDTMKEQCPSCGEIFKMLNQHFTNTTCGKSLQKVIEKVSCQQCGKILAKPNMSKHIQAVHNKVKNVQCPQCEYTTFHGFNLKLHVNTQHLGKQLVKEPCPHCQKMTFSLLHHIKMYHIEIGQK